MSTLDLDVVTTTTASSTTGSPVNRRHGQKGAAGSERSFDTEMAPTFTRLQTANNEGASMSSLYSEQFAAVKKLLVKSGLFTEEIIDKTSSDYYNNLGLNEFYFATSSAEAIAGHLKCVISANVLQNVSKADFFPRIHQKFGDEAVVISRSAACPSATEESIAVQKMVEKEYLNLDGVGTSWRLHGYRSRQSQFDDPSSDHQRLRMCFLQKPKYPIDPAEIDPRETCLSKVTDVGFWSSKGKTHTANIFDSLNKLVVSDNTGLNLFTNKEKRQDGVYRLDFAFRRTAGQGSFYSNVGDIITSSGMFSIQKHAEPLSNGVTILTCFVCPTGREVPRFAHTNMDEMIDSLLHSVRMRHVFPVSRYNDLCLEANRTLQVIEAAYCHAAAKFIFQFSPSVGPTFVKIASVLEGAREVSSRELYAVRARLKQSPFSEEAIFQAVKDHPEMAQRLFVEFRNNHDPTLAVATADFKEDSTLAADIQRLESPDASAIFNWFRTFNKSIKKTNFFKDSLALAFRMDPAFLPSSDFADRPHAIIYFAGNQFRGFHVRFADVARGGIRVVQSFTQQQYAQNSTRAFDEAYNLAHTQTRKNKDIAESGSKGVILLDRTSTKEEAERLTKNSFMRYIDAFLDILLPHERVVDRLGQSEVCFLGPDEFTGKLMDWAALHAKARGAWFWKAFTTGKDPSLGGIPHDTYAMTTASVETYVKGTLQKLGLKEEEVTKCQTGGPDGDLGSNAIRMSKCRLTSLVDGAGVLYDPKGLDRKELLRLVQRRFDGLPTSSLEFDVTKLSPEGFRVAVEDRDITLPNGTTVASGLEFRNEFHLNPLSSAVLFNPCGGRPESVSPFNVDRLLNENGTPRFKVIVEGANVFITQDARIALERRGVILFKDASANKGGVTSSSLEVLAALALNDEEFGRLMCVKDPANPPDFYKQYVTEVQEKIKRNAQQEFEVLWREGARGQECRCQLSDMLSNKIIQLKTELLNSPVMWEDKELRSTVLHKAIPKVLMPGILSLQTLSERVPESYLKAMFSSYLSSKFYYNNGLDASQFAFLEFSQNQKCNTKAALQ